MTPDRTFRIYDTSLNIWHETNAGMEWVLGRVCEFLGGLGFVLEVDPDIIRRHPDMPDFCRHYRVGRSGSLKVAVTLGGRKIEVLFWQDLAFENSNGGRYDFNRLGKMPYLIRLATMRTLGKLAAMLVAGGWVDETDPLRDAVGMAAVRRQQASWRRNHGDAVDQPETQPAYNRTDADGRTLTNGVIRYSRDDKGHLIRGPVFYNMNSMWLMVASPDRHPHQLSCSQLFTFDPAKHPRKLHPRPRRPVKGVRSPVVPVIRSLVERYDVIQKGERITIVLDARDGRLVIGGGYGTHAYTWGPQGAGDDFKAFLAGVEPSYLLDKLRDHRHDEFDVEASRKRLILRIGEIRADGGCTVEEARDARKAARDLDETRHAHDWARQILDSRELQAVLQGEIEGLVVERPDPQLVTVIDRFWPVFAQALRAEDAARPARRRDQLTDLELLNLGFTKPPRRDGRKAGVPCPA